MAAIVGDLATENDAPGWHAAARLCARSRRHACHLRSTCRPPPEGWSLGELDYLYRERGQPGLPCRTTTWRGGAPSCSVTEGEDKPRKYPPALPQRRRRPLSPRSTWLFAVELTLRRWPACRQWPPRHDHRDVGARARAWMRGSTTAQRRWNSEGADYVSRHSRTGQGKSTRRAACAMSSTSPASPRRSAWPYVPE